MSQRISLLVGGRSVEHDSSLHMYYDLCRVLSEPENNDLSLVQVVYIALDGALKIHSIETGSSLPKSEVELSSGEHVPLEQLPLKLKMSGSFVFSLLQGTQGEDGLFQGMASSLDIPTSLGTVFSSALSMNKWAHSLLADKLAENYLKSIESYLLDVGAEEAELIQLIERFNGRNCVLKPNDLGASVFCIPVERLTLEVLKEYISNVSGYTKKFLVQERIFGRELSCGCLQISETTQVLPPMEFFPKTGFLGHSEKFSEGGFYGEFLDSHDPVYEKLEKVTALLFGTLGYETMARFDFIADSQNLYLLESNSKPGLARDSHYTLMLQKAGYSLADLVRISYKNYQSRFIPASSFRYKVEDVFKAAPVGAARL